jgi:hypothetical protein
MNDRLKQYGKNVIEVTAREERLETKVRIHDELAAVLLATRHYLAENDVGRSGGAYPRTVAAGHFRSARQRRGSPAHERHLPANAAKTLGIVLRVEGSSRRRRNAARCCSPPSRGDEQRGSTRRSENADGRFSEGPGGIAAEITNDARRRG